MSIRITDDLVLYDVETLSELLRIGPKTIRRLLRDGTLRGRKLARKWYMTEDDLKAYWQTEPAQGGKETPAGGHQ